MYGLINMGLMSKELETITITASDFLSTYFTITINNKTSLLQLNKLFDFEHIVLRITDIGDSGFTNLISMENLSEQFIIDQFKEFLKNVHHKSVIEVAAPAYVSDILITKYNGVLSNNETEVTDCLSVVFCLGSLAAPAMYTVKYPVFLITTGSNVQLNIATNCIPCEVGAASYVGFNDVSSQFDIDTKLSYTSENPVQNKVIAEELDNLFNEIEIDVKSLIIPEALKSNAYLATSDEDVYKGEEYSDTILGHAGLVPKLSGSASDYYSGDGTWKRLPDIVNSVKDNNPINTSGITFNGEAISNAALSKGVAVWKGLSGSENTYGTNIVNVSFENLLYLLGGLTCLRTYVSGVLEDLDSGWIYFSRDKIGSISDLPVGIDSDGFVLTLNNDGLKAQILFAVEDNQLYYRGFDSNNAIIDHRSLWKQII